MKKIKTKLSGVIIIQNTPFVDNRGKFIENYNKRNFYHNKIKISFKTDSFSYSKKNVLRGIHGDYKTWKLITCISGNVSFVVVNNMKKHYKFLGIYTFQ